MYNSVNRSFIVARQGFHSGERFNTIKDAKVYAETTARTRPGEVLEILECTHNVVSNINVSVINKEGV